jgi:nitrous oxidase accessory protein NosD
MTTARLSVLGGFLVCLGLLAGACVDCRNIYVDINSTGPGDGSQAAPFLHIAEGLARVAPGGTVHVAAGEYYENLVVEKRLTLEGAGIEETLLLADVNANGIEIVSRGVEVTGFSIIGIGDPSPEEYLVAGIWVENANNITARENAIGPYRGLGIAVGYSNGVLLENNLVSQIADLPAYPFDSTGISVHMVNGVIASNASVGSVHGMFVSGNRDEEFELSLIGNHVEGNDYWGLALYHANRITNFSDNWILDNGGPGLSALDVCEQLACEIAGGGDCEEPTTEINYGENNVIEGNNPDFGCGS